MKNRILSGIVGFLLTWGIVLGFFAQSAADDFYLHEGADYQSSEAYDGPFVAQTLYWSYSPQGPFRSSYAPQQLSGVVCPAARDSLQLRGYWTGRLNADGSCGPGGDPHFVTVGNFLNFLSGSGGKP
ncbi:hypothetical protein SAMN05660860_00638 [Geoalkalibacter ferrihydriticus]|uniref:Uncharacterized protein n=2 Tax=Geoalkalibacter ferrihydriticus TaxID=392333 RepID=A0A0C2HPP4_9BACT|nr:hypothetical protein [Geoalkalibacter ferrihydriticus]KIH76925.1 hypothetical protein GFER_07505 [Geoalkalibacter ferrihydriticus DSM 17813]SDL44173.1 hypothetical protein SAMN05660860_00638 [Geoalkalibacter ferrihydriticus]